MIRLSMREQILLTRLRDMLNSFATSSMGPVAVGKRRLVEDMVSGRFDHRALPVRVERFSSRGVLRLQLVRRFKLYLLVVMRSVVHEVVDGDMFVHVADLVLPVLHVDLVVRHHGEVGVEPSLFRLVLAGAENVHELDQHLLHDVVSVALSSLPDDELTERRHVEFP